MGLSNVSLFGLQIHPNLFPSLQTVGVGILVLVVRMMDATETRPSPRTLIDLHYSSHVNITSIDVIDTHFYFPLACLNKMPHSHERLASIRLYDPTDCSIEMTGNVVAEVP